jgi:cobalt-zinc-cadmium efflux system protein
MLSALALTAAFALVEAAGGWWAGSLALLSDAGHMVADAMALGLALFAQTVARRPPSERNSFGYARAEVMGAFVNAVFMLLVVALIAIEAVQRLLHPAPVAGAAVMAIAAAGLAVNLVCARLLHGHHDNLNSRAAYLHVLSDALGSVAALAAGAIIWLTGWYPADPLLSFAVSGLMLFSTWRLLRQSTNVLMEGVPPHLSYQEIGRALAAVPHVMSVHDLHVWHMSSERIALVGARAGRESRALAGGVACGPQGAARALRDRARDLAAGLARPADEARAARDPGRRDRTQAGAAAAMIAQLAVIAAGATAGAWLRWGLAHWLNPRLPQFPLGTLAANLIGGYWSAWPSLTSPPTLRSRPSGACWRSPASSAR